MPTTQTVYTGTARNATILAVKLNGGTCIVELPVGNGWVTGYTVTTDGVTRLETGKGKFRVTPGGGAEFEVS